MRRLSVTAAVLALAWAPQAFAVPTTGTTPTALAQIPESACLVVHLRGVERTLGRFETLLKNVNPDLLKEIEPILKDARGGFDSRQLKGLVADGPHFLVFFNLPSLDEPVTPRFAFVLRTTKYHDFRDSFLKDDERKALRQEDGYESTLDSTGTPLLLVDRKEFTVVTPDKDAAELFTKKFRNLDARVSATQTKRLLESDLGVFLVPDVLGKDYAEEIKSIRRILEETIDVIDKLLDRTGNPNLDLARGLVKPLFQTVEDSAGLLLTLDFRPTGLALHLETEPRKGAPTARAMKEFGVSPLAEMADLPGGLMAYTAWHGNAGLVKNVGAWLVGVPTRTDGAFVRSQREALEQLTKVEPGVRVEGFNPLREGVQSWAFADASKALDSKMALMESLRAGDGFHAGLLRKRPTISRDDRKHGSSTFHRVEIGWDLEKMVARPGQQANLGDPQQKEVVRALRKLIGEDTNVWLGHDGKRVIQVTAPDWTRAEQLLDGRLKGTTPLSKDAGYTAVRKEMPAEMTMMMVVDLPRYADMVWALFQNEISIRPRPRDDKAGPAWLGLAMSLQAERGSLDVFLSAAAVRELVLRHLFPLLGK